MKSERYIWLLAVSFWLLTGCEVIREKDRLIEVPVEAGSGRRVVLVEFTGFRCVNCPKAAEQAQTLKELYGDALITVSMHPASNPFTQGAYDYTCEAADVYYQYMGGTATTPFPKGNVNFDADEEGYLHDYSEWPTIVAEETARETERVAVRRLTWIVEDSVPGVQAMPDGSVNTEYYHRHVLRGTVGDVWGEESSTLPDTVPAGLVLPEGCDPVHCSIVYVLIDEDKVVVNARKVKIENER